MLCAQYNIYSMFIYYGHIALGTWRQQTWEDNRLHKHTNPNLSWTHLEKTEHRSGAREGVMEKLTFLRGKIQIQNIWTEAPTARKGWEVPGPSRASGHVEHWNWGRGLGNALCQWGFSLLQEDKCVKKKNLIFKSDLFSQFSFFFGVRVRASYMCGATCGYGGRSLPTMGPIWSSSPSQLLVPNTPTIFVCY